MKLGVFVQVRLGSTRLRNKALLSMAGKPMIQHVLERAFKIRADRYTVITDPDSLAALHRIAYHCQFDIDGEEHNRRVMDHYCEAGVGLDNVVRVTGDNPFINPLAAIQIIASHITTGADYSTASGLPIGTGIEVIKQEAFLIAYEGAYGQASRHEQEHVTPYFYNRPDKFKLNTFAFKPTSLESFTVDTLEDFIAVRRKLEEEA